MKVKTILFVTSLLVALTNNSSAQNLILNADLEEANICSEAQAGCAPKAWWTTSLQPTGYIKPPVKAFSGGKLITLTIAKRVPGYRTYWETELPCALKKGWTYKIEFYIGSLYSGVDPGLISIALTKKLIIKKKDSQLLIKPSVVFDKNNLYKIKKSKWLKLKRSFVAEGGERVLIFGNFSTRSNRSICQSVKGDVYYCLDGFCLTSQSRDNEPCLNFIKRKEEIYNNTNRHTLLPWDTIKVSDDIKDKDTAVEEMPVISIDTLTFSDVLFKSNSSDINLNYLDTLREIGKRISGLKYEKIEIAGYTDSTGTELLNKILSYQRALNVMQYLLSVSHLNESKVIIKGKGSENPVSSNGSSEGRGENRRVEIYIFRSMK